MTKLYFITRRGTSERVVDHASKPIVVEEDILDEAKLRFANVMRCHPHDLEEVTPSDYFERYLRPVEEARAKALRGVGESRDD